MRTKILFFAESVTTAQVTRLVTLARCLDPDRYEVHFASAVFDPIVFDGARFVRHRVNSIDAERAARALRAGMRLYGVRTLSTYVDQDVALLGRLQPALVVGDFRLSLAVSAPLTGVPHAALVNAYWSPYRVHAPLPVPDHPIVRLLGETLSARYFPKAAPRAFAHFAAPVNELRRRAGLVPIGDIAQVLTYGDFVLYPDPPELVPARDLPESHEYLGYVPWAPKTAGAAVFERLDASRPVVYVTLGSSGRVDVLPRIVEGLSALDVTVLVATAGRTSLKDRPANARVVPFLPGDQAARRSALVVSNGGSSTGYQALAAGTPVLGVPSNLDQYLAMTAIEQAGAGALLPARTLTAAKVRCAASALLRSPECRSAAERIGRQIAAAPFAERFRAFVERATRGQEPTARGTTRSLPSSARPLLGFVAALALTGASVTLVRAAPETPAAPSTNEVRFSVSVESPGGHVICALFRRSGWLEKPAKWARVAIRKGRAECVFSGVAPDVYGISAFHDENDNTRLDTNFLGIPSESWCTSRDAKAFFGPPSFDDSKFLYRGHIMRLQGSLR
jgi:UDP:flavonoid glycosyltransferase YjiC (YdhE family)/uncharacterized protein (DUF2141 family)